jgi:SAM-dependent methyltransferase
MEGHKAPLSYHARMLADLHRMDAYERAIRKLVRPGDVVLDLGCGTGILAMLAARRGARVHAVESMRVAHVAQQLVAHNGLDVHVHHADLRKLEPIEPVDLVIGDFMGCFLVDDRMLPAVEAAGRWLKPGGRFCPSEVRLIVAPVGDFVLQSVDLWREPFYGLDLSPAENEGLRVYAPSNLTAKSLMAAPQHFHTFVPPGPPPVFDATLQFRFERAGQLRALAGWFEAPLAEGVLLENAPGRETHWGQLVFPLPAMTVAAGELLEVRLWLDEEWRWSGSAAGRSFAIDGIS